MSSDLISRSALLAEYDRVHVGKAGGARKLIAEAPAVDAEPVRHGEWKDFGLGFMMLFTCSVCRRQAMNGGSQPYPYCPNCGAKMDGKDTNVPTKAMDGGKEE